MPVLNSDGSVDAAFNVGTGLDNAVNSISPATDGSGDIYVGGNFTTYNGISSNRIIRLNSDGSVDTAFNVGTGLDDAVNSISPATDGSGDIYVGGDFTSYNSVSSKHIIRLNSGGTVDAAFNVGTGFNNDVNSISPATDSSGDIYVVGSFFSYNRAFISNRITRLNSDGSVDTEFNVGIGFGGEVSFNVNSISPATDGSGDIYVGGDFTVYSGTSSNGIIRLNSDGSVDTAFNVGTGLDDAANSISPATDGSGGIYVGGNFTTYNDVASDRIIRLNSNGSIDAAFNVKNGFNRSVYSITLATDGSDDVFIGGRFTTYQSILALKIVRLDPDGDLN